MSPRRHAVTWTRTARRDLESVVLYLAEEAGSEVALRTLDAIESRTDSLQTMPERGRVVPELARFHVRGYRELQVPPYRLIYKVVEARVWVMALFDARRDLEDVLLRRLVEDPG
jgi:toxin ParE1/3/4